MLRIILNSMRQQIISSLSRPVFRYCLFFQPILLGTVMYMIFRNADVKDLSAYATLGNSMMCLWSIVVFSSCGDISRERWIGTLDLLYISPIPFRHIMLGKIMGNTVFGIISFAISASVPYILAGKSFSPSNPFLFSLMYIVVLISFVCFSYFLAPVFWISKSENAISNFIEYPIYLLCGVVFPISILPSGISVASSILPPTWGISVLRMTILGIKTLKEFIFNLVMLIVLSIIYFLLGTLLFSVADKRYRTKGAI